MDEKDTRSAMQVRVIERIIEEYDRTKGYRGGGPSAEEIVERIKVVIKGK